MKWIEIIMVVAPVVAMTMESQATSVEQEGNIAVYDAKDTVIHSSSVHDSLAGSSNRPTRFEVRQNYPNPFNGGTTIEFDLPTESGVYAVVYDILGEVITTLENDIRSPGRYKMEWDGRNNTGRMVSTGVYFYLLVANDDYAIRKMLLLK